MKSLLQISNLTINFQVRKNEFTAVKNLNLSINENQIVGLVGESGSGKSVTAMSIMRLLPEPKASYGDGSSIMFDGEEIPTTGLEIKLSNLSFCIRHKQNLRLYQRQKIL